VSDASQVPVLAKADSMTVEELRDFRRHVQEQLAHVSSLNHL
jgi:septin family protein